MKNFQVHFWPKKIKQISRDNWKPPVAGAVRNLSKFPASGNRILGNVQTSDATCDEWLKGGCVCPEYHLSIHPGQRAMDFSFFLLVSHEGFCLMEDLLKISGRDVKSKMLSICLPSIRAGGTKESYILLGRACRKVKLS